MAGASPVKLVPQFDGKTPILTEFFCPNINSGPVTLIRVGLAFLHLRRESLLRLPPTEGFRADAIELLSLSSVSGGQTGSGSQSGQAVGAGQAEGRLPSPEEAELLRLAFHEKDHFAIGSNATPTKPDSFADSSSSSSSSSSAELRVAAEMALGVAVEIYAGVPRKTALFQLMVDGIRFAGQAQKFRRLEWRKIERRAQRWQQSCQDLHNLASGTL